MFKVWLRRRELRRQLEAIRQILETENTSSEEVTNHMVQPLNLIFSKMDEMAYGTSYMRPCRSFVFETLWGTSLYLSSQRRNFLAQKFEKQGAETGQTLESNTALSLCSKLLVAADYYREFVQKNGNDSSKFSEDERNFLFARNLICNQFENREQRICSWYFRPAVVN